MKTNLSKNALKIICGEYFQNFEVICGNYENKKIQKSKILNFNFKNLGNNILDYPYVEIKWLDIEGDAGWSQYKRFKKSKITYMCFKRIFIISIKRYNQNIY